MSTKEMALNLIGELPGDATIDDIMYLLYIQKKLESGIDDVNNSRTLSNEEAATEFEQWLK